MSKKLTLLDKLKALPPKPSRALVDRLPPAERQQLDQLIRAKLAGEVTYSYADIARVLQSETFKISTDSIRNHAAKFRGTA